MKKGCAIFILISIPCFTFSQYESLFGSASTAWKIATMNLWGTGTDSLRVGNDTTINSLQYKTIYSDYMVYNPQHIHGFIREDTVSGKAWYKGWYSPAPPLGDSSERMIMDMMLVTGDSFYFPPFNTPFPLDTGWVKVDTTYFIAGYKYIRFVDTTHWGDSLLFIEGKGPNTGPQYLSEPANTAPYLLCYYRDGQKLYNTGNKNFQECDLKTTIDESSFLSHNVSVYPHPVSGTSILLFTNIQKTLTILNIYNVIGNSVKHYVTSTDKFIIENKNLPDGIYYYQLLSKLEKGEVIYSGKICFVNSSK